MQKNNKGNSNAPQDAIKEYTANILIVDFIDCIYVKNPRNTALSIISKKKYSDDIIIASPLDLFSLICVVSDLFFMSLSNDYTLSILIMMVLPMWP